MCLNDVKIAQGHLIGPRYAYQCEDPRRQAAWKRALCTEAGVESVFSRRDQISPLASSLRMLTLLRNDNMMQKIALFEYCCKMHPTLCEDGSLVP